jgi:hypothetical protein|tara:strand:- start:290 stop:523 length:234 start_codon:yes stop_codon:yes gene_type:complete
MMKKSKMSMNIKSDLGKTYKQGELSSASDTAVKNSLLTQGGAFPKDAYEGGVNVAYPKTNKTSLDKSLLKKYSQGEI